MNVDSRTHVVADKGDGSACEHSLEEQPDVP